jgi:hypothetical protein
MEEKTQDRVLNAEDRSQEKIKDTCTEFSGFNNKHDKSPSVRFETLSLNKTDKFPGKEIFVFTVMGS